ncbi:hypothetical protein Bbelb_276530 [Branchiostoma belcheri]|nr:hypothetical protein Bbelb_276530 [Branchiostoma belcheri]
MYGADEIIVLVQYRSGICRRHLGKRAGPSRSIYRVVTGGHTVGTPKQARGALSIPFPRYSYKRCRRSHAQAGPCTLGRLNPFTVQSREVMPSAQSADQQSCHGVVLTEPALCAVVNGPACFDLLTGGRWVRVPHPANEGEIQKNKQRPFTEVARQSHRSSTGGRDLTQTPGISAASQGETALKSSPLP